MHELSLADLGPSTAADQSTEADPDPNLRSELPQGANRVIVKLLRSYAGEIGGQLAFAIGGGGVGAWHRRHAGHRVREFPGQVVEGRDTWFDDALTEFAGTVGGLRKSVGAS